MGRNNNGFTESDAINSVEEDMSFREKYIYKYDKPDNHKFNAAPKGKKDGKDVPKKRPK